MTTFTIILVSIGALLFLFFGWLICRVGAHPEPSAAEMKAEWDRVCEAGQMMADNKVKMAFRIDELEKENRRLKYSNNNLQTDNHLLKQANESMQETICDLESELQTYKSQAGHKISVCDVPNCDPLTRKTDRHGYCLKCQKYLGHVRY